MSIRITNNVHQVGVAMKKINLPTRVQSVAFMIVASIIFGSQGATYAIAPVQTPSSSASSAHLNALPSAIIPGAANVLPSIPAGMSPLDPYTPTTALPDYFGTPDSKSGYATGNFANSPLPVSVLIQGAGTGAVFVAEYNTAGAITKFDLVSSGTGYDLNTIVSVIGGGGDGLARGGSLTFDSLGGITSIAVINGGSGYGSANGLRKFVQTLPDLPVATRVPGSQVGTLGAPNFIPASDTYEIAAVRTQWQFSADLGMTRVNLYAQVDSKSATANSGIACPTGEVHWRYPDASGNLFGTGAYITNGAGQFVCFIQTNKDATTGAQAPFSYLGPVIVANQGVPVRVTYDNYLPSGTQPCTVGGGNIAVDPVSKANITTCGGDLFLPVDPTVMGAGSGPNGGYYSTNRSTIHMHGGVTPWITDGTMDQWVSPASSQEQYPAGVDTRYVPDMWFTKSGASIDACYGFLYCYTSNNIPGLYKGTNSSTVPATTTTGGNTYIWQIDAPTASTYPSTNPGNGRMTFYYTNQQTARLMFYHDHTDGITRLNVYSGLISGFLLHDSQEGNVMVAAGVRTSAATVNTDQEKVMVIQDKTFVPSPTQLKIQDPTWNSAAWGNFGSLWFPHVYQPNQNPALTPLNNGSPGATPTGRWDYGPWFWPAVTTEMNGPVSNPLYTGPCATPVASCENITNPGVPNVSQVPEAFDDSFVVNGVSYPVMHTAPKVYRLQILNGSNDRTLNLSLYYAKSTTIDKTCTGNLWSAIPTSTSPIPTTERKPTCGDAGEVAMVPANPNTLGTQGLIVPDQLQEHYGNVVPDVRTVGPPLVEISSEGGLLPDPAVFPAMPIGYEFSNQVITVGNVKEHALLLGPAQRADVLVDLTHVPAGSTLILYNDAPAPMPGWDPRFDYFTGDADQTATGGAPSTLPGYAPNTRTLMQIQVDQTGAAGTGIFADAGAGMGTNTTLTAALTDAIHADYVASQDAPVVAQVAYNAALGTNTLNNVYPALGDQSAQVTSTGVSGITINPNTVPAGLGTPQVLIGDQISATTSEPTSGHGNGARAIATTSSSGAITNVTLNGLSSVYTSSPTVTSVQAPPTGTGSRTAVISANLQGAASLTSISVATNSGYTTTPNVAVTGAATIPAVASAVLTPTSIKNFTLVNGGQYTTVPTVTISGPTRTLDVQTATATLTPAPITSISVVSGGSYTRTPAITFSSIVTGTASATAYLSTSVSSITVTNAGTCTSLTGTPSFSVTLSGGLNGITPSAVATATARINTSTFKLSGITLGVTGSGYTTAPSVVFTPVNLSCSVMPTAVAALTAAPIAGIIYSTSSTATFSQTPGITAGTGGATFSSTLAPSTVASIALSGKTVTDFIGTPTVSFSIPGAVFTANLNPTSVASVTILSGTGLGYSAVPTVTIDAPSTTGGIRAVGTPVMGSNSLFFTILDPGAGYTAGNYTVTMTGGGAGTTYATATPGTGKLTSITVTNPGSGYLTAPTVELLYPNGTTDTTSATAILSTQVVNLNFHPTGIHELFELQYGRMNAIMASEVPLTNFNTQTTIPWSSVDSPTEVFNTNLPNVLTNIGGTAVDTLPDGTQIWRFTHNGVDTHFIHFHMFNVQIIARLGWDGTSQVVSGFDLGWRDTVQMDPLTVVYVAIKPIVPIVPWQIPNAIRPLSPSETMFTDSAFQGTGVATITTQDPMMSAVDPSGSAITQTNQLVNFGWEYMIHCHILGHEEGDMMRPIAVGVVLTAPTAVSTKYTTTNTTKNVVVTFIDNSINETGFYLQRRANAQDPWVTVAAANRGAPTWDNLHQLVVDTGLSTGTAETLKDSVPSTDTKTFAVGTSYQYQVIAIDEIGAQAGGSFPTTIVESDPSNLVYVKK